MTDTKKIDEKNPPSLKDHPRGFVQCENGHWTYSNRDARRGRNGWMFHKRISK
jgi:hypothetical protein